MSKYSSNLNNKKINYWFFPCNLKYYNVYDAFNELSELYWRQCVKNIKIGDMVFIYVGKPKSKLSFFCEVLEINVIYDDTKKIDDYKFNLDKDWESQAKGQYVKLKLLKKVNDDRYSLLKLKENGLNGNIQGQQTIKGELLEYIINLLDSDKKNDEISILDAYDDKSYNSHVEILNTIFKYNLLGHQRAIKKINESTSIWFPKIEKNKNGKVKENRSKWINEYNYDCSVITTIPPEPRFISVDDYKKITLIFVMFGKHNYKFVGAFRKSENESNEFKHVNYRIATKVKLIGCPVREIEIIEKPVNEDVISSNDISGEEDKEDIIPSYIPEEKPMLIDVKNKIYKRSSSKSKKSIIISDFKCNLNSKHESFIAKNGKRYMEAHHLIPMEFQNKFDLSLDVYANIVCLCPNCHKKLHYGIDIENDLKKLYDLRIDKLEKSKIGITLEQLIKLY